MTQENEGVRTGPSRLVTALITAAAIAILAGGTWSVVQGTGQHAHDDQDDLASVGETIELADGLIRVDTVRPEVMAAMIMPASLMPDHVPEGYRRFAVDMSVMATTSRGLSLGEEHFSISGDGLDETSPHRAITGSAMVPDGSRASVSMLFQAPIAVDVVYLHIDGTDKVVLLEGDLGDGHDHTEAPADIVISGFFELEIENYKYQPEELIVAVGTDIRIHNHDAVEHNIVARDGSWRTDDLYPDQSSNVIRFEEPGTFNYYCSIHPRMTGTINVVSR
jgi:plastocyanin